MDINDFVKSVDGKDRPDESLSFALQALWWDRKGDWDLAHKLSQKGETQEGAWVHAYLHRKEGDLGNAQYWYTRAGQTTHQGSLEEEWEEIAGALLAKS